MIADRRAPWISLEGIEGCGKSTLVAALARALETRGRAVRTTKEPGGTPLGQGLRALLLAPAAAPIGALAELLLYAADRAQHMEAVVLPSLARGIVVLQDRHLDATLAYQGFGRGLGTDVVLEMHRRFPLDQRPDRTLLLDLDTRIALARARGRDAGRGSAATEGRFEAEPEQFHERVRRAYLELAVADPTRIRVLDASGTPAEVETQAAAALADLLPELGGGP